MSNEQITDEKSLKVLAVFGEARLLRTAGGLRLSGGSMLDRMEALEWIAEHFPGEVANVRQ